MTRNQALEKLTEELYISYSQIFTYLNCGLKYQFSYVEQRPAERVGVALPFGNTYHKVLQRFYLSLKEANRTEPLSLLQDLFAETLSHRLKNIPHPVIYKKEAPDEKSVIEMGRRLIQTFYESIDLAGYRIVDVELPLSAKLYDENGQCTDFKLIGFLDLLLMDDNGNLVAVDHKTSSKPYAQSSVDADLQLSSYSYLLASNRFVTPKADIQCRLDVIRKLKTPRLEHYHTNRTAEDRRRFAKIANRVLAGIENRIFIPNPSWLCSDCQYQDACKAW